MWDLVWDASQADMTRKGLSKESIFLLAKGGPYSLGSFWQMFSCIRSYFLVESKVEIKNWSLLCKLIKSLTAKHIKKKVNVFTWLKMQRILEEMFDEENPKELV